MSKKTTLTQVMIEALIKKSDLYQDLKKQNDINVDCIEHLNVAVADLTESMGTMNQILKQYELMFETIFVGEEQQHHNFQDDSGILELGPLPSKTNKNKMN